MKGKYIKSFWLSAVLKVRVHCFRLKIPNSFMHEGGLLFIQWLLRFECVFLIFYAQNLWHV